MRFTMVATYIGVILVTLVLMCVYVIGLLSENLYNNEKVDMFAKANIVSEIISGQWGENAKLSELRFGDVMDRSLAGTNIRGVVTDTAYTVIYDTNTESEMIGKAFMRDVLKKGIDGEQAEAVTSDNGVKLISVAVPVEKRGEVIGGVYLAKTVSNIEDIIHLTSTSLIVFSTLIVILIGMLSFGISYIITAPFAEFTEAAKEISKGNFNYRLKVHGTNESAQMAETLNYMSDELSQIEEKRRKFVSDVSHELKTPMAGIKLICDGLVQAPDIDRATLQEFLGDMSDEIDRLTRMVDRLLVLTKLDGGKVTLKLEEYDIKLMLENITKRLLGMAESKNIRLYRLYAEKEPLPAMIDYDKIYEAVYNIAGNAVKYTPDGGEVYIDMQKRDDFAVIRIEDTGSGIPEHERDRVFERFYRLDDSRSRETGGTGLGLAIAKESVTMHGGRIEITDGAAGGSIFTIILPIGKTV